MANTDFSVLLKAELDRAGLNTDLKQVQEIVKKYHLELTPDLQTKSLRNQFRSVCQEMANDFNRAFNANVSANDVFKVYENKAKQLQQTIERVNKIQLSIDTEKYSTDIAKINNQLSKYGSLSGVTFEKAKSSADSLTSSYQKMKEAFDDTTGKFSDNEKIQLEKDYQKELAKTKNLLTQLNSVSDNEIVSVGDNKRTNMIANLNNYLAKNTAMTEESKQKIKEWIAILSSSDDLTVGSLKNINAQFNQLDASLRKTGQLGLSTFDKIKQAVDKFGGWSLVTGAMTSAVSEFRDAIKEIKELDDILTEISKTSDLTKSQLEDLGISAYAKASKYGRTASDYLSGTQSMSQSGFYGAKGEAMAEQSLLAQSAGDMSAEIADKYILATNAAYKFNGEAEKLNAVLDGQNSISNQNSVALEDMATAMSEAGTVASSYNVAIEDFSAMVGTIEAVTKSGGSEVGNSIKSILINLQNVTSSKITGTLDKANASMTEFVNGTEKLRNPIEILRDLATTFNSLDEDDPLRAEILTNVAGKYQASKLSALLQNMDLMDKMLVDYSEGSGSAMTEAQKSANNLTGSLNKLQNQWNELINTLVQADDLKIGVNILTDLLSLATKLSEALGTTGTIGLGAGAFGIFKFVKNFD